MRLINGNQRKFALCEHLGKSGHAQPLRRNEEKLQAAFQVFHARLASRAAVEAGVDPRNTKAERGQLRRLVFHQ